MPSLKQDLLPQPGAKEQSERILAARSRTAVSWRAILLGCLLIPINCYWIMQMEVVRATDYPTTISLFFNAIFTLLVLVVLNVFFRKLTPRWALTQAELLVVYLMLTLASALGGHDMIQVLVAMMGHATWFATPENRWSRLFSDLLPSWLFVHDKKVLTGFYQGQSSLYIPSHWRGWLVPVLSWTGFITVMMFIMLCMNTLLRKQWTERERLSYPLIILPVEMTDPSMNLFKNRLMWIGFGIAACIDIVNGINALVPCFPNIPVQQIEFPEVFSGRPWSAANPIITSFFPFVIGLGTLLPVDLSFSCWFFYIFWKLEAVFASSLGWDNIPGFPYPNFQSFGAYMGIALFALYTSRRALLDVLKRAMGKESVISDEGEAMSYRTALIGFLLGMVLMLAFCMAIGLSPLLALFFLVLYLLLSLAITRMRAELGPPAHDLHFAGPDQILATVCGTKGLSDQNLGALTSLFWFNRAYRSHPMPMQLESYKIAEKQKMDYRRVAIAMMLAAVVGSIASFWCFLHLAYQQGAATARMSSVLAGYFGQEPFARLEGWINNPVGTDTPGTIAVVVGLLFTFLLQALRMRFFSFPFHPVGYAISGSWVMQRIWLPLFVAWLIKLLILRYGGLKAYQKAIPLFLGLVLGEYVIRSLWAIIGLVYGIPTFNFWM